MRSLIAIAIALSIFPPAFASNRQRLFQRQRQQQNVHVQQVRVQRVVVDHHAQPVRVQQVVVGHHHAQPVRVQRVFVQQQNAGCHNDNAGVLQLNGGCSALYR